MKKQNQGTKKSELGTIELEVPMGYIASLIADETMSAEWWDWSPRTAFNWWGWKRSMSLTFSGLGGIAPKNREGPTTVRHKNALSKGNNCLPTGVKPKNEPRARFIRWLTWCFRSRVEDKTTPRCPVALNVLRRWFPRIHHGSSSGESPRIFLNFHILFPGDGLFMGKISAD